MAKGFYIQLSNRSTSRIVFSACTDAISKEAFNVLWNSVGNTIYNGLIADQPNQKDAFRTYYELQISPITD